MLLREEHEQEGIPIYPEHLDETLLTKMFHLYQAVDSKVTLKGIIKVGIWLAESLDFSNFALPIFELNLLENAAEWF